MNIFAIVDQRADEILDTIVAPLATIAALDYPAARVSEIDNSLVHLIQTRSLPRFGLVTICPASDQPPLSKSPSG